MSKRRVADIVADGDGLDEVLVEAQSARNGPRNLRDFQAVRHARAVVVARHDVDLCLVLEPPEGFGVQDAVAVALEARAQRALLAFLLAPGSAALGRLRRQVRVLKFFCPFPDIQGHSPSPSPSMKRID